MGKPEAAGRERKLVVAALITDESRVLITQRLPGQSLGGQWEFPGGKIESGESPEAALERELDEEIGSQVQVGRIWDVLFHRYSEFDLLMLVFHCRLRPQQTPHCREVADLAWCQPSELARYDILPADEPLVRRLVTEGIPAWPI